MKEGFMGEVRECTPEMARAGQCRPGETVEVLEEGGVRRTTTRTGGNSSHRSGRRGGVEVITIETVDHTRVTRERITVTREPEDDHTQITPFGTYYRLVEHPGHPRNIPHFPDDTDEPQALEGEEWVAIPLEDPGLMAAVRTSDLAYEGSSYEEDRGGCKELVRYIHRQDDGYRQSTVTQFQKCHVADDDRNIITYQHAAHYERVYRRADNTEYAFVAYDRSGQVQRARVSFEDGSFIQYEAPLSIIYDARGEEVARTKGVIRLDLRDKNETRPLMLASAHGSWNLDEIDSATELVDPPGEGVYFAHIDDAPNIINQADDLGVRVAAHAPYNRTQGVWGSHWRSFDAFTLPAYVYRGDGQFHYIIVDSAGRASMATPEDGDSQKVHFDVPLIYDPRMRYTLVVFQATGWEYPEKDKVPPSSLTIYPLELSEEDVATAKRPLTVGETFAAVGNDLLDNLSHTRPYGSMAFLIPLGLVAQGGLVLPLYDDQEGAGVNFDVSGGYWGTQARNSSYDYYYGRVPNPSFSGWMVDTTLGWTGISRVLECQAGYSILLNAHSSRDGDLDKKSHGGVGRCLLHVNGLRDTAGGGWFMGLSLFAEGRGYRLGGEFYRTLDEFSEIAMPHRTLVTGAFGVRLNIAP